MRLAGPGWGSSTPLFALTGLSPISPGRGAKVAAGAANNEALHGAAALLGGQPHLRFVHEAVTDEDAVVQLLG
ncbi:hypothetical protein [Streptomyces decoyicus]|uniref:hypothetical protein n=1 Tax=Streptomyces decoyicus TaxID=249567 RepID=UPI0033A902A1